MTDQSQSNVNNEAVATHFSGKSPNTRVIYEMLLQSLARLGPVQVDPKKTSIHLVSRTAFGGVQVRKQHLVLTLRTAHPIENPRIKSTEHVSKNRYHQTIHLASPSDLDQELQGWLEDAYRLGESS